MDSLKLARMLVDINVTRADIVGLTTAMTPAKNNRSCISIKCIRDDDGSYKNES